MTQRGQVNEAIHSENAPVVIGKAILLGMPVRIHDDGGCTAANLFADLMLTYVLIPFCGFNGAVIQYHGSYWSALWYYLTADLSEGDQ